MYDVAIIGAGVTGAAIARALSRFKLKIIVLDKENDVSCGTSKANSGIIHGGYDPEENTLMAKLNSKGNPMFDKLCSELDIPFKRIGSLVVAYNNQQLSQIKNLHDRGINNNIKKLKILSKEELRKREPNINPDAVGALLSETAGIIDPMLLTISLMENAVLNGCEVKLNFTVLSIEKNKSLYLIKSESDSIETKYVINAAGVFADKIHNMANKADFKIKPRRGQYFLLDKCERGIVNSVIFPCPDKMGKGTLITPTVHGNIMLGPSSDDLDDPEDLSTTADFLERARMGAKKLIPKITTRNSIRTFAGIRAESDTSDYIIRKAPVTDRFIDVAGIKSPGITTAPSIAE